MKKGHRLKLSKRLSPGSPAAVLTAGALDANHLACAVLCATRDRLQRPAVMGVLLRGWAGAADPVLAEEVRRQALQIDELQAAVAKLGARLAAAEGTATAAAARSSKASAGGVKKGFFGGGASGGAGGSGAASAVASAPKAAAATRAGMMPKAPTAKAVARGSIGDAGARGGASAGSGAVGEASTGASAVGGASASASAGASAGASAAVESGAEAAPAPAPDTDAHDDLDIPQEFMCAITKELFRCPVITSDGHSYERDAIKQWLEANETSPLTGQALPDKVLRPNHSLRAQIVEFRERQNLPALPPWSPDPQEVVPTRPPSQQQANTHPQLPTNASERSL